MPTSKASKGKSVFTGSKSTAAKPNGYLVSKVTPPLLSVVITCFVNAVYQVNYCYSYISTSSANLSQRWI